MARDELQEQVEGAIKVGEVDVETLIGRALSHRLWR
jgi:hypothetical protein